MSASRPTRIVIRDAAEPSHLRYWWAIGAAVISGADVVLAVRSWDEAYTRLEAVVRKQGLVGRPVDLQVWGHGYQGAPLIAGKAVSLPMLADALVLTHESSTVWFRACDVAEGPAGHRFMAEAVVEIGCTVVAHCAVISLPYPWEQREICALRPGEPVWWSLSGEELQSCSTFRMTVPAWAYRHVAAKAA